MDTIGGCGGRDIPVAVHERPGSVGTVVILPGSGYTPAHPLLHFTGELFHGAGFTVFELWWGQTLEGLQDASETELAEWLGTDALAAADAAAGYGPLAGFVTKSLGTIALAAAATERSSLRDIPAVWLTPILQASVTRDALSDWQAPNLAVIAEQDPVPSGVNPERLGDFTESVLTEGTNHGLERDDPVESTRVLESVLIAIRDFVERIR